MLTSIRALRACAALLVVVYHVQVMLALRPEEVSNFGASGVDIFFVISGFIMMFGQFNNFQAPSASARFFQNRLIRIVPLYYLFTTISIFILLFIPGLYANLRFDVTQAVSSYLFLFSDNNAGEPGMVVGVAWTLAFEMFFYCLFAVLLKFPRKWAIPGLALVFSLGNAMTMTLGLHQAVLTVFSHTITYEFIFGAIIGVLVRRRLTPPPLASLGLISLGILGLTITSTLGLVVTAFDNTRFITFGLPAAALVAGAVFLESAKWSFLRVPRWLLLVGDSSYSLYLVHKYVLALFGLVLLPVGVRLGLPRLVVGALAVSMCALVGYLCYLSFERPVASYLTRWRRRPEVRVSQT